MDGQRATEVQTKPPGRREGSAWWLISRYGGSLTDVLTLGSDGEEEALAVFSFDEEAELFLRLGTSGADWRIEAVAAGDLFSRLLGPRARIRRVALDPFPEVAGRRMVDLVCVSRERFVQTYGSGYLEGNDARLQALP